jgi:hypothetical protein
MDIIPLKPERKAQLEEYAQRHGQDAASALDEVVATYLEWERQDYDEAVEGIRRGYKDVKAGRTRPAAEFLEELRVKHGFPRCDNRKCGKRSQGHPGMADFAAWGRCRVALVSRIERGNGIPLRFACTLFISPRK